MNEPKIVFRPSTATDDPGVSRLLEQIFGMKADGRFLAWKYRGSPAGEPLTVVADKGGEIIGQMAGIPTRLAIGGIEHVASQEVDVCMDQERGKFDTLFHMVRLRRQMNREQGMALSYLFSLAISSHIAQRLGYALVSHQPQMVRLLNVESFLRRKLPVAGLSRLLALPPNGLLRLLRPWGAGCPEGTRIRTVHRFDERFDALWKRVKGDYPIMTVRDSAYLNWRYLDIPDRDYRILAVEHEATDEVLGFVVLGIRDRDIRVGQVLDILTPRSGHRQVVRALLAEALRHFYAQGADVAICWMYPHCHVYPELTRLGFLLREKEGFDIVFRVTRRMKSVVSPDFLARPENWYVCIGDSDL